MNKKYLIVSVPFEAPGGIANYYRVLWENKKKLQFDLVHFEIGGGRKTEKIIIKKIANWIVELFLKAFQLRRAVTTSNFSGVILNPSLNYVPLIRDLILLAFIPAKVRRVVFIRGWGRSFSKKSKRMSFEQGLLLLVLKCADTLIVQANSFRADILSIKPDAKIYVLRTLSSETMACDAPESRKLRILFMGRLSKEKGVYCLMNALQLLSLSELQSLDIKICGLHSNGSIPTDLWQLNDRLVVSDCVSFMGEVRGDTKEAIWSHSDVLVFPSVHNEGCPNTVIEAFSRGKFIISTRVGAVPELLDRDGVEGGILLEDQDPKELAGAIQYCLRERDVVRAGGALNLEYYSDYLSIDAHTFKLNEILA